MEHASIIAIDLAKSVFQVHGARSDGTVVFRRKLTRSQLCSFVSSQSSCIVAMEACAGGPVPI